MDFSKTSPNRVASGSDAAEAPFSANGSGIGDVSPEHRDPLLACLDEFNPPFTMVEPAVQSLPVVFSSPHSGRNYPSALLAASSLDDKTIRRSEDSFVDELFASAPALGAPLLCAEFPRVFCDVNREAFELDPAMFKDALPHYANSKSTRVASGLGTIARLVADGVEIYRHKLHWGEAEARIARLYHPYHEALEGLLRNTKARFGSALLIDCHSMPSKFAATRFNTAACDADIVLGDRFGHACAAPIVDHLERALTRQGLTVRRNAPFAGGFCTEHYGCPDTGIHAVQVEINRSLYMDEKNLSRHEGLEALRGNLSEVIEGLRQLDPSELSPS